MAAPQNKFVTLVSTILICTSYSYGANIFCVFPTASYSHQQPLLALSHGLAAKGHNLTVITANPSKVPIKNHRDIDISSMYDIVRGDEMEKETGFSVQKRSDGFDIMKIIPQLFEFVLSKLYRIPQVQNIIKEVNGTKYDLLIYEETLGASFLGLADLIGNPPVISVSTVHLPAFGSTLGNPTIPSYIPSIFFGISDHMSFWERCINLYFQLYTYYQVEWHMWPMIERYMHKNFGNVNRKINELLNNQSLLIVSTDLATGYPKPMQPNMIHVGPMHLRKELDPLPQDIQKWMDESEDGVIYFSLGSNMKGTSVPAHIREAFIKAFKQFPKVRVLWKWESDTKIPGQPDNVLGKKWLPQQPILAHPKVKLFISQVGLQSFEEATYYGVPILGVPMFGDQDFNAKKVVDAGIGLSLEFQSITYDTLYEKLKDLLTNKRYKENMLRQKAITRDTPMSPVDTAIWWVEYVLRHNGAPHLKPAALDLTLYQYYMLDILSLVFVSVLIILFAIYFVIKKLIHFSSLKSSNDKSNIKNNKKKTN